MSHTIIMIRMDDELLEVLNAKIDKMKRSPFIVKLIRDSIANKSFKFELDDEMCFEIHNLKKLVEKNNLVPLPMEDFINYIFTQGFENVSRHVELKQSKEAQKILDLDKFNHENVAGSEADPMDIYYREKSKKEAEKK